jgi:hypothetical protein
MALAKKYNSNPNIRYSIAFAVNVVSIAPIIYKRIHKQIIVLLVLIHKDFYRVVYSILQILLNDLNAQLT